MKTKKADTTEILKWILILAILISSTIAIIIGVNKVA